MAREEWRELPVDSLARSCAAQLEFGSQRRAGQVLLRVRAADASEAIRADGRGVPFSVIDLISDDMPFLVDTLRMSVRQAGLAVQLIIHPILQARRDGHGRLRALSGDVPGDARSLAATDAAASGSARAPAGRARALRESWQHLRLDAIGSDAEGRALERRLHAALADLRQAYRDWAPMRRAVLALADELEHAPSAVPAQLAAEGAALLRYMEAHHFTFLGMRESRLERGAGGPRLRPLPHSARGLLRHRAPQGSGVASPRNIRRALREPAPLVITKANERSSVHRPAYLDYIGVKRYAARGRVVGETRIIGLWTSSAYSGDPRRLPWVRLKLRQVLERFPFAADSHDGKRLVHILESLPRDELLQAAVPDLIRCARTVLRQQELTRVRLYLRRDQFHRFWSCLVFLPRERCEAAIEQRLGALLRAALHGQEFDATLSVGDAPLAQLHVVVRLDASGEAALREPDVAQLERAMGTALVSWRDRLQAALGAQFAPEQAVALARRYAPAFPAAYVQDVDAGSAVEDIVALEGVPQAPERMQLRLYRPPQQRPARIHLRIVRHAEALSVSEVLPTFEHFGLRLIAERPYRLAWPDAAAWVQDFELEHYGERPVALERVGAELLAAFRAVRAQELADDGFNRLLLAAELTARQVTVLRACCRYLLQTGIPFSQSYMERVLATHAGTARELVELFEQRLAPLAPRAGAARARALEQRVRRSLAAVSGADEDRILRAFLAVVLASLRTNYFVRDASGTPRPSLAIKLDPRRISGLPQPRPAYEVFVFSPRLEALHLRQGAIARGGIRWSERPEDFRTEILGLMKAQHVKNTLIVPVGAKGGFIARRLADGASGAEARREIIDCYAAFMRALLDVTDNIVAGRIVPPAAVRRLDADDPYLVVAADKGTASFSDIANGIAAEYGFWLGDAFASGGSSGYDHKRMGITARGAWECVKRHFRELGIDYEHAPFTVAGIGDMSGDVFGNGMLLSPRIRLLAAFDHRHIFIDPDPDPRASFAERARLFRLPRSSWMDYRRERLSAGGAVYERRAKAVTLSPEARRLLGLPQRRATPAELIRAILCLRVELLWNGGIGTYVKASTERHSEIGDRANDAVRVDGRQVRARVVAEGGNLGFSQRGRVEYAAHGGRINADFIDNSAGVNTSDLEVNLKILLDAGNGGRALPRARRNRLLAAASNEVAQLVLRNNYLQSQAISVLEMRAVAELGEHQRLLRWLERHAELDRAVEHLPSDEELEDRRRQGRGLTRPELALLLAYGKIALNHALTQAGSAADPYLARELQRYFPTALRRRYRRRIEHHRLRSQIIITAITNSCVNRIGPALLMECSEYSGAGAAAVARAYTAARDSAELRGLWAQIEAQDGRVAAADQYQALWQSARFLRDLTLWLLAHRREYAAIGASVRRLQPALRALRRAIPTALGGLDRQRYTEERARYLSQGFPAAAAESLALLAPLRSAGDLAELMRRRRTDAHTVVHAHFGLAVHLGLDWLHAAIERLAAQDDWQRAARMRLQNAARAAHLHLTEEQLRSGAAAPAGEAALRRWQQVLTDVRALPRADTDALLVAVEELESLSGRSRRLARLL